MDIPDRIILQDDAHLFVADATLFHLGDHDRICFADTVNFRADPHVPVVDDDGRQIGWGSVYIDRRLNEVRARVCINYNSPERLDAQLADCWAYPDGHEDDFWYQLIGGRALCDEVAVTRIRVSHNGPPILRGGKLIPQE